MTDSVQIYVNESVTCNARANPTFSNYYWIYPDNNVIQGTTITLYATSENSTYKCYANNSVGGNEARIDILILTRQPTTPGNQLLLNIQGGVKKLPPYENIQ